MKINGSDLMVFADTGKGLKSVAFATGHTMDVTMNTIDTSTKDDGNGMWQNFEAGMMGWTMTTNNLMSDVATDGSSFNELFQAMLLRTPIEVAFALQVNNPDYSKKLNEEYKAPKGGWTPDPQNQYHGKAMITSLNITANNGEKATATATFTGCGNIQMLGAGIQSSIAAAASLANAAAVSATAAAAIRDVETATLKK